MIECVMIDKAEYLKLVDLSNNLNKVRVYEVEIGNNIDEYVYREVYTYKYEGLNNTDYNPDQVIQNCIKTTIASMFNDPDYSYLLEPDASISWETQTYIRDLL